jgi:NAD(P)-dependent dehydrogenase (short-subunit alcohol dehydrogenase family)
MPLDGARVWVTGASSGIGEALVAALVRRGARVAVTARRTDLLAALAARHAGGRSPVLVAPADVTDPAAVAAAAKELESAWGGIDLAIFNAGGSVGRPPLETRDPRFVASEYTATMALNYFSVVYGIEAVLPGMLARGSGRIAAVASLGGYRPSMVALPYTASKAAVIHLMEGLRLQVSSRGIAVTVVSPGFVRTPLTARNSFKMPFLVEVDDAADRIVRGLERGKDEIIFPAPLAWAIKLLGLLPNRLYGRIITRAAPK